MIRNNSTAYHERDQGRSPADAVDAAYRARTGAGPLVRGSASPADAVDAAYRARIGGPVNRATSHLSIDAPFQGGSAGSGIDSSPQSTIYRSGNHFSDIRQAPTPENVASGLGAPLSIDGDVEYARGQTDIGKPGGGLSVVPSSFFTGAGIEGAGASRPQYRTETVYGFDGRPRTRQVRTDPQGVAQDRAREAARTRLSALQLEASRAEEYAKSVAGGGKPGQFQARGTSLAARVRADALSYAAANAVGDIGALELSFVRTPEQEAALAQNQKRHALDIGILEQKAAAAALSNRNERRRQSLLARIDELPTTSPQYREAVDRLAAFDGRAQREAEAERFGNPVDELDERGRPIRAQYGNQGTRRVVDGAAPMPKTGGGVTVGPDGTLSYTGGGSPKLTEGQSKDLVYYTRGAEALKNLGATGEVLADPARRAGAALPGIGNALVGANYQQAEQAGREFLAAVLRKDTGAAVTKQEFDLYGKTYLPQPFDTPETLQQKAQARATALEAIRSGMGPAQQLVPDRSVSPADAVDAAYRARTEARKDYSGVWR